jgi:flagellar biosynthesis protein FlhA
METVTKTAFRTPDVQFAVALIGIVFVMIVPLPPIFLDVLLCVSIAVAFMVLLISIYVKEPLDFSTFPTVLLISTLFRLSLNVATTRSILLDGATGQVSEVIRSFGQFVVGGNYFVGFVVFTILVIINFIVITKGAGRVAEVGARFTLDAMPGKQMSIDADLNAGAIDREEAKARRLKIEREADFYGAMDGASKFVRGDAIAGIVIAIINIVVGLIVGVVTYNMTFGDAAQLFTLLTVGDGLVSQIPALIISTASGIVVTRAGGKDGLTEAISDQVTAHSKAIYLCSGMLGVMALVPGLPTIPFIILSVGMYFLGRAAGQKNLEKAAIEKLAKDTEAEVEDKESIDSLLRVEPLVMEVGVGLIPLVDNKQDGEILDRIISTRKQFAQDMGIVVPMVMVRDNIQLRSGEYQILLKGNVVAGGNLMVDYYMAMDPGDIVDKIDGIDTKEPAYGLDAMWIKGSQKDDAIFRGYTVVNCATVVVTHLTKIIEENASLLIGRQEAQHLIDQVMRTHPKVVDEVLGTDRLVLGDFVRILQNLLDERVSVRDCLTILETVADHCKNIKNPDALTRYVRKALGRSIVQKYKDMDGKLVVITLDRAVEDLLVAGLQYREDGSTSLQLEPQMAQRILAGIAESMNGFQNTGTQPILLCGSLIRWDLRQLIGRFIPGLCVIAFDELPAGLETKSIGIVSL